MGERERIAVLLVDDHQMFVQSLVRMLEREAGFEVVGVAGTAAAGIALARTARPDVVLMDYQLPDVDGAAATSAIKSDRPETKVLMLTALLDENILLAAIEAGCSGYVTKNLGVEELVAAISAAHAGEAIIAPTMLARLLPRLRTSPRGGVGEDLTRRELEVLRHLAAGSANKVIAEELFISVNTVRNHVQNLMVKLHAHSKLEAVATAVREGIIESR